MFFWHQSEARTAATVWNWSGKTLSPGALLAVLYFSSFHIYFSALLDFLSPPLSAPGSPRMQECTCKMDKSLNRGMLSKFESRKICVAGYQCDNSDFDFALRNTASCL